MDDLKQCSFCGEHKPKSDYYPKRHGKDGLQAHCKPCNKARAVEWAKKNPSSRNVSVQKWRTRNPEAHKRNERRAHIRRHGISPERYEELLAAQHGCCAACGDPFIGTPRIDHDHTCCPGEHSCGKCVRGLLHDNCNKAIGLAGDDPVRLRALAAFLEGTPRTTY